MKQVIIVAPQFPPCNLAAVHRSRLFATHLPKFGWQVRVLSVASEYYEEPLDQELEELLPEDLDIIRTHALRSKPIRLIGDIGLRALWWHYRELRRLIRESSVDMVYLPIPPNYSSILGPLLYRAHGIPYTVDYIDPWVHPWPECEVAFSRAWLAYHCGRLLEPIVLKRASLVTAVAPGYYEGALVRNPFVDRSRCMAMPYGAEGADFSFLDEHPRPPTLFDPNDGNRHIVYAGAMLPRAYSTLEALLNAIRYARDCDPVSASRLRVHFIGTGSVPSDPTSYMVKPLIDNAGLSETVREYPVRIRYLDVLNHLKHAHAILVLGSSEPHYTPSKVFQAVLSKRPVLGLLHSESTGCAILREANAGRVITFNESEPVSGRVPLIAEALLDIVADKSGYSPRRVNWQAFQGYSAEAMAEKLAMAFDDVLSRAGN